MCYEIILIIFLLSIELNTFNTKIVLSIVNLRVLPQIIILLDAQNSIV